MDHPLTSPTNGRPLLPDGPGLLTDGETRWPVVAGIPFLRPHPELRAAVVADLEAGDERTALRRLLADQDRFSPTPPPSPETVDRVIGDDRLNLRTAMELLNFGPVGDYFAYRWCSPTFTGGLHMLERTPPAQTVIEVACGIGHFLRALEGVGRPAVGIDIVFAKLWLGRRFLGLRSPLICADIERSAPLQSDRPTTVFCHDAFYFFERKEAALDHMRAMAAGGSLAIGHVHTRRSVHETGYALEAGRYTELTTAPVRDDTAYVLGWYGREASYSADPSAIGWIEGESKHHPIEWVSGETPLRATPLLRDRRVVWPSSGWQREYTEDSRCLNGESIVSLSAKTPPTDRRQQYRQRRLLNLPARW